MVAGVRSGGASRAGVIFSGRPGPSLIDLTGQRFGKLVVIARAGSQKRDATWHCLCDCATRRIVRGHSLRVPGSTRSCGRLRNQPSTKAFDLTGERFGRLTDLARDGHRGGKVSWRYQRDCGRIVTLAGPALYRRGNRKPLSCGCTKGTRAGNKVVDLTGRRRSRRRAGRAGRSVPCRPQACDEAAGPRGPFRCQAYSAAAYSPARRHFSGSCSASGGIVVLERDGRLGVEVAWRCLCHWPNVRLDELWHVRACGHAEPSDVAATRACLNWALKHLGRALTDAEQQPQNPQQELGGGNS